MCIRDRGPHESYADRKSGAAIGRYASTPAELYHPYIRPQENGQRTDTRGVTFRGADGTGLLAAGMRTFDWSALPYLMEDLDEGTSKTGRHTFDLPARDLIAVHLDHRQMGVGGDNSWGAQPLEPYRSPVQTTSWSFRLTPLAPDSDAPMDSARTVFPEPTSRENRGRLSTEETSFVRARLRRWAPRSFLRRRWPAGRAMGLPIGFVSGSSGSADAAAGCSAWPCAGTTARSPPCATS